MKVSQDIILKFVNEVLIASSGNDDLSVKFDDSSETIVEWDSLFIMTMASSLSSRFKVKVTLDDLERLSSVEGIVSIIND
jgi:acyl carrier protein|tara:strand:+ start:498 stop:737 length:240 start_codon:yes stop_codon:yes gene_type:complete